MYQLEGTIKLDDGTELTNPQWEIRTIVDDINSKRVYINVRFFGDCFTTNERMIATMNYTDTWEDADLYSEILSLTEFQNSTLVID